VSPFLTISPWLETHRQKLQIRQKKWQMQGAFDQGCAFPWWLSKGF
jgi:hypothetical protein